MPDHINQADESDRVLVDWDLVSDGAAAAAAAMPRELDLEALRRRGAVTALETGGAGQPVVRGVDGDLLLCHTPADIIGLRRDQPELARDWRLAMREVMCAALGRGLQISAMTRSGWYVLAAAGAVS